MISFRAGTPADAEKIARLHIVSWQTAYRDILSDKYLDDAIVEDRLGMWTTRLASDTASSLYIRLAELEDKLVGFVCAIPKKDREKGTLIDNLHVHPSMQGQGLGRKLMQAAAQWVVDREDKGTMYLWVYESNQKARGFYERMGGEAVEQKKEKQPDGRDAEIVCYLWREPAKLLVEAL